jgi:hypothetical protein
LKDEIEKIKFEKKDNKKKTKEKKKQNIVDYYYNPRCNKCG